MANGFFIALEGIDGSGKSTLKDSLAIWLRERTGQTVVTGREPKGEGEGVWATHIRHILMGRKPPMDDPFEFQRMYVFDRGEDIHFKIRPAVKKGHIVLFDRYALSTLAYGMLSDISIESLHQLHKDVIGDAMMWPHLNILLDLDPSISLSRKSGQYDKPELFEKAESLKKIREAYLTAARHPLFADSVFIVDASQSPDEVYEAVKRKLETMI